MMFRVVFLLALLFPGIASAACALGPNPNWWGCTTPLSGAAQGTDMIDAGRPSLGVRASGPITINQLFQAMTGAQVNAALGFAPAAATQAGIVAALGFTPLATNGDASVATTIANGTSAARTLADRAADVINIEDISAVGDTADYSATVSVSLSTPTVLTATTSIFTNAKIGQTIGIPNAGATGTTGIVTSLPIVSKGSGYTSAPIVSLSGSPTTVATVGVVMGVDAATKTAGGTGCPASTTITFSVATTTAIVPLQISMTTDGSGNATGTPTIVAGQWYGRFPVLTGNPAIGSSCAVQPVFTIDVDVDHFCVGNAPGTPIAVMCGQTGYGLGYLLSGITASLSGGSPAVAAVPGVPVITPYIQTLETTIASVDSPTQVHLAAAATTAITSQATTIRYGTFNPTAVQTAVNQTSTSKRGVFVPNAAGCFMIDQIALPNYAVIDGPGQFCMRPGSLNPMFNVGTSAHVRIQNITAVGNLAVNKNPNSGSAFVVSSPGATDLKIFNTKFYDFTHHGVSVDGVDGLDISHNTGKNFWFGAGIIVSSTTASSHVIVDDNIMSFTQLACVEVGFVGVMGGSFKGNTCYFGGNNGNGDGTNGHVSDCFTGYTALGSNERTEVTGNSGDNCGNNGVHWGASDLLFAHNAIKNAYAASIFIGAFPNSAPPELINVKLIGNHCTGRDKTDPLTSCINVRNTDGLVVSDNTGTNVNVGFEGYGFTAGVGARNYDIHDNKFDNAPICINLRHKVQYSQVHDNICRNTTIGVNLDNAPVSGDGSFASFFNTVGTNIFDTVPTQINEVNGANFNTISEQISYNDALNYNLTGANTVVQSRGGSLTVFSTPGSFSFAFPAYATTVCYSVFGAGSSGANAHAQASGTATSAGAAGSSGGVIPPGGGFKCVAASTLTSPVSVTVGAGGASPSGDGAAGNVGSQSCFGTDCAGGGGAPSGGSAATNAASGASGSVLGVGNSASGATAGTVAGAGYNIAGAAGAVSGNTLALGGASGAGSGSAGVVGNTGGSTITGASGGGSGGGLAAVQVGTNGGRGGSVGATVGGLVGQVGVNNGDATAQTCSTSAPGLGGSGGASNVLTRGGNGAAGCLSAGGGGGGSTGAGQTPGVGGAGGGGLVGARWSANDNVPLRWVA